MSSPEVAPKGPLRWLLGVHSLAVFAFFYLPIGLLVVYSFSEGGSVGEWGGFTTEWYRAFAESDEVQGALSVSLRVAVVSTLVSVVLGTMAAFALERFRFRGRQVFDALLYLPIIVPDVTMAVMLLIFFDGALDVTDSLFGWTLTKGFSTIVVSHIAFNISFVSVVVRARLTGMDAVLDEAAADLYANRWQTFRHVTLPLIVPGVAGGALLAFTLSLDDVVITQFVAGPGSTTLPVYVFGLIRRGITPLINAVSVVMLGISILLVLVSLSFQRGSVARRAEDSVATAPNLN